MDSKWIDEYKRLSEKMNFFSRASSFLLSILSVFSLSWVFWWTWQLEVKLDEEVLAFIVGVAFHLIVIILFVTRFVLSFFKSKKSAKFSQILWFVGFLTITSYCFYSLNIYFERMNLGLWGGPGPHSLNWADNTFSLFCWFYLISCVIKFFVLGLILLVNLRRINS